MVARDHRSALERNSLAIARAEQIERDLLAWTQEPITFGFDPSGTHLFSMVELERSFAKRCIEFAASIRLLIGANRIVSATVIARALIETVAMGCLYLHDMRRLIDSGDCSRLNKRLFRFASGFKGNEVEPIHVMDALRHLEKIDRDYIVYLDNKYGAFTKFLAAYKATSDTLEEKSVTDILSAIKNYDLLSEVSHPNALGTQHLFPDESNENLAVAGARARFRSASLMAIWQCHHLLNARGEAADLPDRYRAAFMPAAKTP